MMTSEVNDLHTLERMVTEIRDAPALVKWDPRLMRLWLIGGGFSRADVEKHEAMAAALAEKGY